MNPTLQTIHQLLLKRHSALSSALESEEDLERAKAILLEMREILHRIDLVQSLLFRQTSKRLENTLPKIRAANAKLGASLKAIGDATRFVKAATEFLTLVDKAIDIAKTLAPLAAA